MARKESRARRGVARIPPSATRPCTCVSLHQARRLQEEVRENRVKRNVAFAFAESSLIRLRRQLAQSGWRTKPDKGVFGRLTAAPTAVVVVK